MRAAIYARYSTTMQTDASIEDQVRLCREHAKREGWDVVSVLSDAATSGATILRPGLQAILEAARGGAVDIVLAEALDRVSRDQEDIAGIYKRLLHHNVALVTLSEGEIGPLHIGLKGTMNALFLKDLAAKTRRGMRGRLEQGKAVAGLPYGYRVTGVGDRAIVDGEAAIVRRIFADYANGISPKAIARALNREGVPGPRGKKGWAASTINGTRARGNGILNNEIYVGRRIWNRQRMVKDPDSRKRLQRQNTPDKWVIIAAPDMRIVDQEVWDAVKVRQASMSNQRYMNCRRPKYLLSGIIKCGCCGGGMSIAGDLYIGCTNARERQTCTNRQTIRRDRLEAKVLAALEKQMMQPELFAEFCAEFTKEINRARMERRAGARSREAELAKVTKELDALIDALAAGVPPDRVKERMQALEMRRAVLGREITAEDEPKPYLHPNMANVYRERVADLAAAITKGRKEDAAANHEAIRTLIERVVISPATGTPQIEIVGDLAGILAIAAGKEKGRILADAASVKVGAGLGFVLYRSAARGLFSTIAA